MSLLCLVLLRLDNVLYCLLLLKEFCVIGLLSYFFILFSWAGSHKIDFCVENYWGLPEWYSFTVWMSLLVAQPKTYEH